MKKKVQWSLILLTLFITIGIVSIRIYSDYKHDKTEYEELYQEYTSINDGLLTEKGKIIGLMNDETYYEDCLYQSMVSYYNSSNDEVFRRVFQERFPLPNEFENDRRGTFVIIYALLEVYPEIKENSIVNESLLGIDNTSTQLSESIAIYNDLCDNLVDMRLTMNDCNYVTKWDDSCWVDVPEYVKFVVQE